MTPGSVGATVTNSQVWGGEYVTVNVQNGANYTFSMCTGNSYDTYMSIYQETPATLKGFNDNFCSTQSQITWTADFTGVLRVLLDQGAGCGSNAVNSTITVRLNSLPCTAGTISGQPTNVTVCPNGTATFTGSGSGTPDSLRWFRSTNGGSSWLLVGNGAPYSGATTGSLTVNPATVGLSGNLFRLTAYYCSPAQGVNSNSATLTVQDGVAPTAVCRNITRNLSGSTVSIIPGDVNNGSSDNCGTVSLVSVSPNTFNCTNIGANTVTLTINDGNGNQNTCTATVTVADVTSPTAVCRNISRPLSGSTATITPADINNGSSDNCGAVNLVSVSPSSFTCANLGSNTVTLTINDGHGNQSTCSGTVTISDTTRPTLTCPSNISTNTSPGSCSRTGLSLGSASSTDNCTASPTVVNNAPGTFPAGSTNVVWTSTDGSGNSRTCTQVVTIQDQENPTAVCQNVSVNLGAAGTATVSAGMVNNGSSDNCSIASSSLSKTAFTCADEGANSVTLTVVDGNGNSNTCTATVTVNDNLAPTAVCQGVSVNLNASGTATVTPAMVNNGSTDNCGLGVLSLSMTNFTCANLGNTAVTLTVPDVNGNSSTCTVPVFVQDNLAPTAVCQNVTVTLNGGGTASITPTMVNNGSTDNCSVASTSLSQTSFTCAHIGTNTVTLTVTDGSNNSGTCTATVTVNETTAPVAMCQSVSVNLNAGGTATVTPAMVNNGSSDNCSIASMTLSQTSFTCAHVGSNTVTLTVTDGSSNTGTCTTTVTVNDNLAPTAVCQNVSLSLNAGGTASLTPAAVNNGSTDNCALGALSLSTSTFGCANLGANSVTLTVPDVNGNSSTCTSTVTVVDNLAPTAVCQNVTVALNGGGTASITPTMVNNGSSDNCGVSSVILSQTNFTCANAGNNTVTLTVTDGSGNSSTCTSTVTVQETTPPTAVCQNVSVNLNGAGTATVTAAMVNNGSTDNCGVSSVSLSATSFTCANIGSNSVTLTVTDGSSNSSTCTATVTVADNMAPVMACQNVTVNLSAGGTASVTTVQVNNGSTDNCGSVTMTLSTVNFTCANLGANGVTLIGIDGSGNSSSCTATVTVTDNLAPTAVCQNVTVTLNGAGNATLTPTMVNNGSSDNCAVASTTLSQTNFTCANIGANSVTLTVTDAGNNSSTCTSMVTVQETTAPSAVCQNVTLNLNAGGTATVTPTMVNNGSSDNCSIASTTLSQTSFGCGDVGANSVVLTVTDGSGNSSTCTASVTVNDVTAPVAVCQDVTGQLDTAGVYDLTPMIINNGSSDACGIDTMTVSQTQFVCADTGQTTVTLTVVDVNGNSSTCTAVVTMPSNPVAATLAPLELSCGYHISCAGDSTGTVEANVSGGCPPYVYTWSNGGSGSVLTGLPAGLYSVTVTDAIGRTQVSSANLTAPTPLSATIQGSAYACAGDSSASLNLSVAGGNDCQTYTYLWNDGDTDEDRTNLAGGNYSVTITDAEGCTLVVMDTVEVAPLPVVNLGADTSKCIEDTLVLNAGAGFVSYAWSTFGTGMTEPVSAPGSYAVVVTDTLGCEGGDTIVVTDRVAPANFVTAQGPNPMCIGDVTVLTGAAGFSSYAWSNGGLNPSITITGMGGTFSLIVTDAFGCAGIDSATIQYFNVAVPNPVITPGPNVTVCQGSTVSLNAGGGYAGYVWSNGPTSQAITVGNSGVYTVTVTNGFGCIKGSAPVTVTQAPNPVPTITFVNDTLHVQGTYASYQWLSNSVQIPGAILAYYVPTATGVYSVMVVDSNGCTGVSDTLMAGPTGLVDDLANHYGLVVYPNPTRDYLMLAVDRTIMSGVGIAVKDLYGKTVLRQDWSRLTGQMRLDLPGLASGMYVLELVDANGAKASVKFVIE